MKDSKEGSERKVTVVKMQDGIMETKFEGESLSILVRPRKAGRIFVHLTKKSGKNELEHYPQRFMRTRPARIIPFRVSISPRGIEDFNGKSIRYRRGETIWYKADPEAKPEILAFRGLVIWSYNEFIGDVNEEGVLYSLAYNPVSEKILAYRIVSVEGETYLKNSANVAVSGKFQTMLLEEDLPEKDLIDTAHNIYQGIKRKVEKIRRERDSIKGKVGRQKKIYIDKATLWCIKNHSEKLEHKRPTLLRAYKKFKGVALKENSDITEDSFLKMVSARWNKLLLQYSKQPIEFKEQNSKQVYAKSELKIPRSYIKQRVKVSQKTFN